MYQEAKLNLLLTIYTQSHDKHRLKVKNYKTIIQTNGILKIAILIRENSIQTNECYKKYSET